MIKHKNGIALLLFFAAFSGQIFANRIDSLDITHYNLSISLRNIDNKQISGKASISGLINFNQTSALTLDLLKLGVDSILIKGKPVNFTNTDSTVSFILDKEYYQADSIQFDIYYKGSPVKDSRWGGFFFSGNYAFNMGVGMGSNPPNFGRCWFPCNDNFIDRATYEFHITTDSGFMAVCSGLQEPATNHLDGSITWNWRLGQTIPTYIANVAVSKYVLVSSNYAGIQRNIPIVLAVAAADTLKAKASFARLNQAMQCFEERFGPYLFDRIGYVGVPFNSGAMEHACNISYPLYAVDGTGNYETLMAHELSHHWWGNLVTTRVAADMWLNEGWASYCEALFLECVNGRNAYDAKIGDEIFEYLRWAHVRDGGFLPVSGVPLAQTYGTHVYTKGGAMVHTLRSMMGDSAFFAACRYYLKSLPFRDVISFNLMDYFTGFSKVDMVAFFNVWIYDAGDLDLQIVSLKPKSSGVFVLKTQVMRRHKTEMPSYLEVVLSLYDLKGNKTDFPVTIRPSWDGSASNELNLDNNIAFMALNENNKLALAKTTKKEWIKSTGAKTYSNTLFTATVQQVTDSVLLFTEHHFAGPNFSALQQVPGIRISAERYWHVDGLFDENFKATAFFNYDGSTPSTKNGGFLDNELIKGSEDSLVLLYRPNAETAFVVETDLTFQPGGSKTDKVGRFWVNNLKKGDYAFGYKDFTASVSPVLDSKREMNIFPNPTEDILNIELPIMHLSGKLSVYDYSGTLIELVQVKKNDKSLSIETKGFNKGAYILVFEDSKGMVTKNFIVK
ncbi:MAG: M1 family aminopeptidase [bacterium]|nr:M1 family aminopeptidase [bacterium]